MAARDERIGEQEALMEEMKGRFKDIEQKYNECLHLNKQKMDEIESLMLQMGKLIEEKNHWSQHELDLTTLVVKLHAQNDLLKQESRVLVKQGEYE